LTTSDGFAIPADLCPRCGRALADYFCLHCAGEDEFGDAALVRTFVSFPDLYSKDTSARPWPDEWPATPVPAVDRERLDATPAVISPARDLLAPTGWVPRGLVTKVVIAGGSILLAAVIGIVGAVVAGPAPRVAPPSSATPAPPSGAATDRVVQGLFCMDATASGADNGNPIRLVRCDTADGQRWTFAPDGAVRALGRCMRPVGGASAYGTKVELWDCDGTASQQWRRGRDAHLVHPASGACLEGPAPADAQGAQPQLAVCGDGPGQRWELP
jgi:hypothetical protein